MEIFNLHHEPQNIYCYNFQYFAFSELVKHNLYGKCTQINTIVTVSLTYP